jgi:type III pantothenate kinase
MEKYLVIDQGNSRIKTGYFQQGLPPSFYTFGETGSALRHYFDSLEADRVLISSSAGPKSAQLLTECLGSKPFVFLDYTMLKDNALAYKEPETLGKDRLAALKAAKEKWPGKALCVADAGTCLTLDFMDAHGRHLGGTISPGLQMRFTGMHQFTGALPLAGTGDYTGIWGKSTLSCLASGSVNGLVAEIEYHFNHLKISCSEPAILILTGGDAEYLAHHLNSPNFAAPHLVLEGLFFIVKSLG